MKQLLVVIPLAFVCVFPLWGQGDAEKELLKLENDWSEAWAKNDTHFLDQLYAMDYAAVSPAGNMVDKAQGIKEDTGPDMTDKSFKLSDMKARVYGETGVVMGRNDVKYKKGGKAQQMQFTFTDVFVKRDGRWQVVASQATPSAKKAATPSAKTAKPEKK